MSEIVHTSDANQLIVPMGHYSQFRLIGNGIQDDTVTEDMTSVSINVHITAAKDTSGYDYEFDLFLFDNQPDYECYLRALDFMENGEDIFCGFVHNDNVAKLCASEFSYSNQLFINKKNSNNTYFFVIDNTNFPSPQNGGTKPTRDAIVTVSMQTTYTAKEQYSLLILILAIACFVMIGILVMLVVKYRTQKKQYRKIMAEQRKRETITAGGEENEATEKLIEETKEGDDEDENRFHE